MRCDVRVQWFAVVLLDFTASLSVLPVDEDEDWSEPGDIEVGNECRLRSPCTDSVHRKTVI